MSGTSELSRSRRIRIMAFCAGIGVALLGSTALLGWLLHSEALKSIMPGAGYPIKPNIALGMLLCGAAVSILSRKTLTDPVRICAGAIAATVLILAALSLAEYLLGWDLGIDHWLVTNVSVAPETSPAGRMPPATAICLSLVAVALFRASQCMQKSSRLTLVAGLGGILIAAGAVPLSGFALEILFGARWNYMGIDSSSIPAAVAFLLLGGGLLALLRGNSHLTWSLGRA